MINKMKEIVKDYMAEMPIQSIIVPEESKKLREWGKSISESSNEKNLTKASKFFSKSSRFMSIDIFVIVILSIALNSGIDHVSITEEESYMLSIEDDQKTQEQPQKIKTLLNKNSVNK